MTREEALRLLDEKFEELIVLAWNNMDEARKIFENRQMQFETIKIEKTKRIAEINAYYDAIEVRSKADEVINKGIEETLNVKETI